jgi:hypothetical protein
MNEERGALAKLFLTKLGIIVRVVLIAERNAVSRFDTVLFSVLEKNIKKYYDL